MASSLAGSERWTGPIVEKPASFTSTLTASERSASSVAMAFLDCSSVRSATMTSVRTP